MPPILTTQRLSPSAIAKLLRSLTAHPELEKPTLRAWPELAAHLYEAPHLASLGPRREAQTQIDEIRRAAADIPRVRGWKTPLSLPDLPPEPDPGAAARSAHKKNLIRQYAWTGKDLKKPLKPGEEAPSPRTFVTPSELRGPEHARWKPKTLPPLEEAEGVERVKLHQANVNNLLRQQGGAMQEARVDPHPEVLAAGDRLLARVKRHLTPPAEERARRAIQTLAEHAGSDPEGSTVNRDAALDLLSQVDDDTTSMIRNRRFSPEGFADTVADAVDTRAGGGVTFTRGDEDLTRRVQTRGKTTPEIKKDFTEVGQQIGIEEAERIGFAGGLEGYNKLISDLRASRDLPTGRVRRSRLRPGYEPSAGQTARRAAAEKKRGLKLQRKRREFTVPGSEDPRTLLEQARQEAALARTSHGVKKGEVFNAETETGTVPLRLADVLTYSEDQLRQMPATDLSGIARQLKMNPDLLKAELLAGEVSGKPLSVLKVQRPDKLTQPSVPLVDDTKTGFGKLGERVRTSDQVVLPTDRAARQAVLVPLAKQGKKLKITGNTAYTTGITRDPEKNPIAPDRMLNPNAEEGKAGSMFEPLPGTVEKEAAFSDVHVEERVLPDSYKAAAKALLEETPGSTRLPVPFEVRPFGRTKPIWIVGKVERPNADPRVEPPKYLGIDTEQAGKKGFRIVIERGDAAEADPLWANIHDRTKMSPGASLGRDITGRSITTLDAVREADRPIVAWPASRGRARILTGQVGPPTSRPLTVPETLDWIRAQGETPTTKTGKPLPAKPPSGGAPAQAPAPAGRTFRIVPSRGAKAKYDVLAMRVGTKHMNNTRAGEPGSLGNPYPLEQYGGEKGDTIPVVIEKFRKDFLKRVETDPEYRNYILSLRDKNVGYFRGDVPDSHVKVIQEWLAQQPETGGNLGKGIVGSALLTAGLGGALSQRQEETPTEEPPTGGPELQAWLEKQPVTTAGFNLEGIRELFRKGAQAYRALPTNVRRAADLTVMPAVGAATGDVPGTLALAGVSAAFQPAAIPIQDQIQNPEVRKLLAPYVAVREAERRGQQIRDLRGADSPFLSFQQRWIDRMAVVKDALGQAAAKAGAVGKEQLQKAGWVLDLAFGGGMSDLHRRVYPLQQELKRVRSEGLADTFRTLIDLKGMQRAAMVVREHAVYYKGLADRATTPGARADALAKYRLAMSRIPELAAREADALRAFRLVENEVGPQTMARLEKPWALFQDLAKANNEFALEKGLISKADFDLYARRPFYVPLHREQGELDPVANVLIENLRHKLINRPSGSLSMRDEEVYRELMGSLGPTQDPFEAMYRMTAALQREGAKTTASKMLAESIIGNKSYFRPAEQALIRTPGGSADPNPAIEGVISWFENGDRNDLIVPKLWAEAVNFVQPVDVAIGFKVLNRTRSILQAMATGMNLAFASRNVPRDLMDTGLLVGPYLRQPRPGGRSIGPGEFLKAWGKASADEWLDRMSPEREEFSKLYADFSTITSHMTPDEGMWGFTPKGPLQNIGHQVRRVLNATEKATKIATLASLRKAGYEGIEAAALTREFGGSPDFAKGGDMLPVARNFWMFFGPQVQGVNRMFRRYAKHPELLAGTAAAITAATAALYRYNSGFTNPDTGVPEIEMVPLTERRTNFIIMTGQWYTNSQGQRRMTYLKIPMGHTMQALATPTMELMASQQGTGTPAQAIADSLANLLPGTGQIDVREPVASTARGLLMGLNPLIKMPMEQALNLNTFTRAPIVGRRVEQRIPSEQWTERTSPFMVDVGQALGHVPGIKDTWLASPDRLEAAYRSFFPGPGEQILSVADYWRRAPQHREGAERITGIPGVGPITRAFLPSMGSEWRMQAGDVVFDQATRAQKLVSTINDLLKINPTRAQELLETNPEYRRAIALNPTLQGAAKLIAELSREKIRIANDRTMPTIQKRDLLRRLYLQEIEVLRNAERVAQEHPV